MTMKIAIIGTGYVGLTTGVALAYTGNYVVAVDKDVEKIGLLASGRSPIHEPGVETLISMVKNQISFSTSVSDAINGVNLVIIAVGTPSLPNGEADTHYVTNAAREIGNGIRSGASMTIAIKSTVPIGTNSAIEQLIRELLHTRGVEADVSFASNPEFLREGAALQDTLYPDRIVVGSNQPKAHDTLFRAYRPVLEQTFAPPVFLPRPEPRRFPHLVTTDPVSAEMIKYASNCFLALKISYINEIAGLCENIGADVTEVARGIGLDSRIGYQFLDAGLGWGGSCFPKDTSALLAIASKYYYPMPIINATREVNYRQRQVVIEKLKRYLGSLPGKQVGVLGLAFKPNTDDVRDSPALDIIRLLLENGVAVTANDPAAIANAQFEISQAEICYTNNPYDVADGADAIILATDWDEYRILDLKKLGAKMRRKILIDGRNLFNPGEALRAGFIYSGIGR